MTEQKRLPVNFSEQLAQMAAAMASRVQAPSGDTIQVSQQKEFAFPDGTTSPNPFHAVIVDFVSVNTFYKTRFDRNNITPPACFAYGDNPALMVPSNTSPEKQAESCTVCPNNQFGSDGKGKACKNQRLLAVIRVDEQGEGISSESPLWLLRLSPTAIKAFDSYVTKVARTFNVPPIGVVSHIGFDPNSQFPSIRFGQPAPNKDVNECMMRLDEARSRLMVEPDVSTYGQTPVKPAAPTASARSFRGPRGAFVGKV